MEKIDFKKEFDYLYKPSAKEFSVVTVPKFQYLMFDGKGNPNTSPEYQIALEALYSVSYTLKFASKKEVGKDYVVPPLEGLWWADDMSAFQEGRKDTWKWTMMIMVPDWINKVMVKDAIDAVEEKKSNPKLRELRFESLKEGKCVQIMHIGSYDNEAPVLDELHNEYMPHHGLTFSGKHHEIYLGDPRKTVPSKLRTILRQPVKERSAR